MSVINANVVNCASIRIEDTTSLLNIQRPYVYSDGTASIAGCVATGIGTTWTASMVGGYMSIAGTRYAITGFTDATTLDVSSDTDIVSPATVYSIDYLSRSVSFDMIGSADGTNTTLSVVSTADRTITFPDVTDTMVGISANQTLTNKILSTGTNFSVNPVEIGTATFGMSATNAIAIGQNTSATQGDSIAIGNDSLGSGQSVAIGSNVLMNALTNTYSVGTAAVATGTATGTGTTWISSMVGGFFTIAGSTYKIISFGSGTSLGLDSGAAVHADQAYSLIYGAVHNTIIGYNTGSTLTTGGSNTIIGADATTSTATVVNAVAIGQNTSVSSNSIVIGSGASSTMIDSIVIGSGASSNQANSLVIGKDASVMGINGLAIGLNAKTGTGANNTAVGIDALSSIVSSIDNTAVGYNSLTLATGDSNTSVGSNSLNSLTTGLFNTAMGNNALTALSGVNQIGNVAVGYSSGSFLTSGSNNIFVGHSSGLSVTTAENGINVGLFARANANHSLAIGWNANALGVGSIAIGQNSTVPPSGPLPDGAFANSDDSIAIGAGTFVWNNPSIAIGRHAGVKYSFGIAIGNEAHTSGNDCVFIGMNCGNPAETSAIDAAWADSCTAIGARTLNAITGGAENTAIGTEVLTLSTSLTYSAGVTGVLGGVAGGFGTAWTAAMVGGYLVINTNPYRITGFISPTSLSLDSGAAVEPVSAYIIYYDAIRNTGIGAFSLSALTSASNNTAIGYNAGLSLTTGSNNVAIGSDANVGAAVTDSVVIGFGATSNGNNSVVIGSGSSDGGFPNAIVIGQGVTAGSSGLHFQHSSGAFTTNAAGFDTTTGELVELVSARKFKTNIRDMESVTDRIYNLRPVRYNALPGHGDDREHIGFIAEEVEELFPEFVTYDADGQPKGLVYDRMIAVLIRELKDARDREISLESRISLLENRNL